MNQVNTVYYNQLVTIFLIVILTGSFLIQDYTITYLSMSVLLFWVFVRYSDLNIKAVTGFFFAYYFIPLPNISTYRGTIVYSTLLLYTLMLLLGILPLLFKFKLKAFRQSNTGDIHLALIKGEWDKNEPILVRVHSSCMTGDIFGSCRCDCGSQLHKAMEMVEEAGKGVIVYMNQEGRGIGLINKLKAYQLQEQGRDTVEANEELGFKSDERDYGIGAQILRDLNVRKIKLISNNPKKRAGLIGYGLEITDRIPIEIKPNEHNEKYLQTKRDKLGHDILN